MSVRVYKGSNSRPYSQESLFEAIERHMAFISDFGAFIDK